LSNRFIRFCCTPGRDPWEPGRKLPKAVRGSSKVQRAATRLGSVGGRYPQSNRIPRVRSSGLATGGWAVGVTGKAEYQDLVWVLGESLGLIEAGFPRRQGVERARRRLAQVDGGTSSFRFCESRSFENLKVSTNLILDRGTRSRKGSGTAGRTVKAERDDDGLTPLKRNH